VAPLVVQQQRIGALTLESVAAGAFGSEHIDVATQVATSLAVGLESARRYSAAQQELVERKLAEDALRQSEAALRQKAEDLAARNAELDAFSHTVAHDLKTPLSLLTGYTSYMAAGEVANDSAQLDWCVRAIGQSARKMHNIIDELLLLSSVRKVDEVAVQPLDMDEIVSEVLIRLSDLIAQENAEILKPDNWPIAWGYAQWIEEVWANYVSNALKYGGTPPRIELGATRIEADPSGGVPPMIRFWVRDNGDGLTDDQQDRLFVPFERLDQARAKGYGLGLSIVQRIMEKLGGSAGVESSGIPGQGSTFFFILPEAELPV
jgi:signal transduction histidine kinase